MNKDVLSGAAAYVIWGFFPIYFKAIQMVPALQIVGHRVVWSFLILLTLITVMRGLRPLRALLTWRILLVYLVAGVLLSGNWLIYVWAVNAGLVLETSLGYFINPLVNVLLGTLFLHERLRPMQWAPVGLAAVGVIYLTVSYGSLPWVALALAFSFGFYGLVKKLAPLGSLPGLTLETGAVFIPALIYLLVVNGQGTGAFGHAGLVPSILMGLTGVVTAIPLILFANSARTVSLSTLGLLQYIAPTLQFIIGVFLFGEPFTSSRVIGFCIIWLALIIFSAESLINHRRLQPSKV